MDSLFNGGIKSDLLLCCKFLAGHADVDVSRFFTRVTGAVTRGNIAKLYRLCSARDSNFFANRVINIWNSLPTDVVNACSVFAFKRKLHNLKLPQPVI